MEYHLLMGLLLERLNHHTYHRYEAEILDHKKVINAQMRFWTDKMSPFNTECYPNNIHNPSQVVYTSNVHSYFV